MAKSSWSTFASKMSNAWKIDKGWFEVDKDMPSGINPLIMVARFTWAFLPMLAGNLTAHVMNNLFTVNVDYYRGATLVSRNKGTGHWGFTMGSYINAKNVVADPTVDSILGHEYGHTFQSYILGPLYLPMIGFPSLIGQFAEDKGWWGHDHNREWYEVWANQLSYDYFDKHSVLNDEGKTVSGWWDNDKNPRVQHADWYFYATMTYYAILLGIGV